MNINDYTYLLSHPESIQSLQTTALEHVLHEFPYLQSARALYLKGLYQENSYKYNAELKRTAAHTTDRSILFDFITSVQFHSMEFYNQDNVQEETETFVNPIPTSTTIQETKTEEVAVAQTQQVEVAEEVQNPQVTPLEQSILKTISFTNQDSEQQVEVCIDLEFLKLEAPENTTEVATADAPDLFSQVKTPQEAITEVLFEEPAEETPVIDNTEPTPTMEHISPVETITQEITPEPTSVETAKDEVESQTKNQNLERVAEKLSLGKPLNFDANESHSFQEWLQLTKTKPIERENTTTTAKIEVVKEDKIEAPEVLKEVKKVTDLNTSIQIKPIKDPEKLKKLELIDKFIETNPKIVTSKTAVVSAVNLEKSNADNSYLMTETLAKVYLEQKKYQKAIQAYEILILKYPEKSVLFAERIADIKNLQYNNN